MKLKKTIQGNAYIITGYPVIDKENQRLADRGVGILSQYNVPNFKKEKKEFLYQKSIIHINRIQRAKQYASAILAGIGLALLLNAYLLQMNRPLLSPLSDKQPQLIENTDIGTNRPLNY